jgi:cell division protein FtsZ
MPTDQPQTLMDVLLLLEDWARTQPVPVSVPPGFRHAFTRLVNDIAGDAPGIHLDLADIKTVMQGAVGLAIGQAEASGPRRALRALTAANEQLQVVGRFPSLRGHVLLAVQSRPDAELEMEELTDILEALQQYTGPEWEVIFGHDTVPTLSAEIRFTLLLAHTHIGS